MIIFSKRLLLKSAVPILDDDYLMASSKKILNASSTKSFLYLNTPQILVDSLSNIN